MYFQNHTSTTQTPIPVNQWTKKQHKPKSAIHNPFTHKPRSKHAESLLTAILALLQYEAKAIGLETEAIQLTHKILKTNYLERRC